VVDVDLDRGDGGGGLSEVHGCSLPESFVQH
jgi:hypothetical protein